jgi:hypothetical protein
MKKWLIIFSFLVVACATWSANSAKEVTLPVLTLADLGPAPELTNDIWLNTESPLRLADLRGKVVAIDMWTFG